MPQIVIVRDGTFGRMAISISEPARHSIDAGVSIIDGNTRVDLVDCEDVFIFVSSVNTEIYTDQEARDKRPKSE